MNDNDLLQKLKDEFSAGLNRAQAEYFEKEGPVSRAWQGDQITEAEYLDRRKQVFEDYQARIDQLRLAFDQATWRALSDMRKGR
jgi:hypothetical protein